MATGRTVLGVILLGAIATLVLSGFWFIRQTAGEIRPVVRVLPRGYEKEVMTAVKDAQEPSQIPLFTETAITVTDEETGLKVEVFRMQFDGETIYAGEMKVTVPAGEAFFYKGMVGIRLEGNRFIFLPKAEYLEIVGTVINPRPPATATPAVTATSAVTTTPTTPPNPTATAAHTISLP